MCDDEKRGGGEEALPASETEATVGEGAGRPAAETPRGAATGVDEEGASSLEEETAVLAADETEVSGTAAASDDVDGNPATSAAATADPTTPADGPAPDKTLVAEGAAPSPAAAAPEPDRDGTAVRPLADLEETAVVEGRAQGPFAQLGARARTALAAHRRALAVACALVAVLAALLAVAGVRAGSIPADDVVAADARTRVSAPDYDGGKWGDSNALQVSDVKIKSVRKTESAIDPSAAIFGASGYAQADVEVTFENDSVTATKTATLGFAKVAGSWTATGGETATNAAFEAKKGVDAAAVKKNLSALLERAEQSLHEGQPAASGDGVGELSLAGIYASAQVSVSDSGFDAESQTDSLHIELEKTGTFDTYSAQVDVDFAFRPVNGLWEIVGTRVSDGAKARSFEPLVGTWTGTFQSQETDGAKCLAAATAPLTVTISEQGGAADAAGTGAQLIGTVSGLAHFHANPESDAQGCAGDAAVDAAALAAGYVKDGADGSDLAFRAELPDQAGGNVQVTLEFGTATDPSAVVAVVESDYEREASFLFIPYSQKATYRDTYVLRRQQ